MVVTNLLVQIKKTNNDFVCCVINFRDGHSLEVVTNLCFATLMDVSKHVSYSGFISRGANFP